MLRRRRRSAAACRLLMSSATRVPAPRTSNTHEYGNVVRRRHGSYVIFAHGEVRIRLASTHGHSTLRAPSAKAHERSRAESCAARMQRERNLRTRGHAADPAAQDLFSERIDKRAAERRHSGSRRQTLIEDGLRRVPRRDDVAELRVREGRRVTKVPVRSRRRNQPSVAAAPAARRRAGPSRSSGKSCNAPGLDRRADAASRCPSSS